MLLRGRPGSRRCRAVADPSPPDDDGDGDDTGKIDIDALAARLSAEASRLWAAQGGSSADEDSSLDYSGWAGPGDPSRDDVGNSSRESPSGNATDPDDQAPPESIEEFRRRLARQEGDRGEAVLSPPPAFELEVRVLGFSKRAVVFTA